MNNTLKHIGLQINENDIPFYTEVLNCKRDKSFILNNYEANAIFNIDKPVKVIYFKLDELKLELFLTGEKNPNSFNHICIQTDKAEEIANNAIAKGFKIYTHFKNDIPTYFIADHNNNIFEIKKGDNVI